MTRPRKPFGANHPGRLPSTMIKVLAAEMSDPQRLRRGKQYAKDGSVLDIQITPGVMTCEVQGSRATPYSASIHVTRGDGMPLRRDITTSCTCPDADWDGVCKHVIAAMFVFADELLLEPELLDAWRARPPDDMPQYGPGDHDAVDDDHHHHHPDDDDVDDDWPGGAVDPTPRSITRGHLRLVGPGERAPRPGTGREQTEPVDRLAGLLAFPDGTELPDELPIEPLDWLAPADRRLADVLQDALRELRALDWDE